MKACSLSKEFDFICEEDRKLPTEQQTVWRLRRLTFEERAYLYDHSTSYNADGSYIVKGISNRITWVHLGIVGVKNFQDEAGRPVELIRDEKAFPVIPGGAVKPFTAETIDRIGAAVVELSSEIINRVNLSEEESKN